MGILKVENLGTFAIFFHSDFGFVTKVVIVNKVAEPDFLKTYSFLGFQLGPFFAWIWSLPEEDP